MLLCDEGPRRVDRPRLALAAERRPLSEPARMRNDKGDVGADLSAVVRHGYDNRAFNTEALTSDAVGNAVANAVLERTGVARLVDVAVRPHVRCRSSSYWGAASASQRAWSRKRRG